MPKELDELKLQIKKDLFDFQAHDMKAQKDELSTNINQKNTNSYMPN